MYRCKLNISESSDGRVFSKCSLVSLIFLFDEKFPHSARDGVRRTQFWNGVTRGGVAGEDVVFLDNHVVFDLWRVFEILEGDLIGSYLILTSLIHLTA